MAAHLNLNPQDFIFLLGDEPRTTSLKVAEAFGKLHKHVLAKIDSLDCSPEFTLANFSAHVENQQVGTARRDMKYYEMTKDGFMFLVMGFTGAKAAAIKEAYINAFNWMAKQLADRRPAAGVVSLDWHEARRLFLLHRMLAYFKPVQKQAEEVLRTAESPLAGKMHDAWSEPSIFCFGLNDAAARCLAALGGNARAIETLTHDLPAPMAVPRQELPTPSRTAALLVKQYRRLPAAPQLGLFEPVTQIESARRFVEAWARSKPAGFMATIPQIAEQALGVSGADLPVGDSIRIGLIMRQLRWHKVRGDQGAGRYWAYQKPRY